MDDTIDNTNQEGVSSADKLLFSLLNLQDLRDFEKCSATLVLNGTALLVRKPRVTSDFLVTISATPAMIAG